MHLLFAKTKWEATADTLSGFLSRTIDSGFTATEIHLPSLGARSETVRAAHDNAGLALVGQITTEGETPADHIRYLDTWYPFAVACGSITVNSHTGSDAFSFSDNLSIFRHAITLERTHGVTLCHELHRGRALFSAPDTLRFARALPELRFTADFSHWQVVHESDDLARHSDAVAAVIARAWHIHARVGFSEAPQVPDPRAPEWVRQVDTAVAWWRRIVGSRQVDHTPVLTVSPEFGPTPYMPAVPYENRPVADAWELNCWMRDHLALELSSCNPASIEQPIIPKPCR
jgi:hypothetical protein